MTAISAIIFCGCGERTEIQRVKREDGLRYSEFWCTSCGEWVASIHRDAEISELVPQATPE